MWSDTGPKIPWLTPVHVWREADGEGTAVVCQLIDNGPDMLVYPNHALDLTCWAAANWAGGLAIQDLPNDWDSPGFSYRIVGAASFAPAA